MEILRSRNSILITSQYQYYKIHKQIICWILPLKSSNPKLFPYVTDDHMVNTKNFRIFNNKMNILGVSQQIFVTIMLYILYNCILYTLKYHKIQRTGDWESLYTSGNISVFWGLVQILKICGNYSQTWEHWVNMSHQTLNYT